MSNTNTHHLQTIIQAIKAGRDVLLVGPSDSGKSSLAVNDLVPGLEKAGLQAVYLKDMTQEIDPPADSIVILDEFEILEDKEYLEDTHPDERPYYTDEYLGKVEQWLKKAKELSSHPRIFILTRNRPEEIENLKRIKQFDWSDDVVVIGSAD